MSATPIERRATALPQPVAGDPHPARIAAHPAVHLAVSPHDPRERAPSELAPDRTARLRWRCFLAAHLLLPPLAFAVAWGLGAGSEMPPVPVPDLSWRLAASSAGVPPGAPKAEPSAPSREATEPAGAELAAPWQLDVQGRVAWRRD